MKISNLTTKTSLEIQDTDVLVIQDGEDTKQVSVADLKVYMASDVDKNTKILINETLDNIVASILASKYVTSELKIYTIKTWINSDSGVIEIALKNSEDNWLIPSELVELFSAKNGSIQVLIEKVYLLPVSIEVSDFNTIYPDNIDSELNGAGFIRIKYDELSHNQIAGITYDDIKILLPETKDFRYEFVCSPDLFENSVPYEENIE